MKTKKKNVVSPKPLAELEDVLADLAAGRHDPQATDKATREMDRMREQTQDELGMVALAEFIRAIRDEA